MAMIGGHTEQDLLHKLYLMLSCLSLISQSNLQVLIGIQVETKKMK